MSRPEQSGNNGDDLATLKRIFGQLDYHVGVLEPETAQRMREQAKGPPEGWMTPDDTARTKIFRVRKHKIGVLVFPLCTDNTDYSGIAALAEKLREETSLLIGLSPWGANREKEFLQQRPGAVDVLLGSGSGPSFKAKFPNSGKTLWIRAYSEGKAIHRIDIADLGPRNKQKTWIPGKNCSVRLIMLEQSIPRNPSILEILR